MGRVETAVRPRQGQHRDVARSGPLQGARAGAGGRPGRKHVIHEQHPFALDGVLAPRDEGRRHVPAAGRVGQSRLRRGEALALYRLDYRQAAAAGEFARQQGSLVETPLPQPAPVQRHGNDHIKALVQRERGNKVIAERLGQCPDAAILVQVDEVPQRAVVSAEAVSGIEGLSAAPAQSADAFFVQWKTVEEGGPAAQAEVFGFERRGEAQAIPADGNAGQLAERVPAQPAFFREKVEKQTGSARDQAPF